MGNAKLVRATGAVRRADRIRRVERPILVRAIAQRILQIIEHAERSAEDRLSVEGAPGDGDPRLRQEIFVIIGEQVVAHLRQANVGSRHG